MQEAETTCFSVCGNLRVQAKDAAIKDSNTIIISTGRNLLQARGAASKGSDTIIISAGRNSITEGKSRREVACSPVKI